MGANQRRQVVMSEREVTAYVAGERTATMATIGADGVPHLVAMWYGFLDGAIYFETKAKSQKAVNLRRDPTIAIAIESGDTYDQLQGVALEGVATLIEDNTADEYWQAATNIYERYFGPYEENKRPWVEGMMNNRIVVKVVIGRVRSWNHRKLGMPPQPYAGSTARGRVG